MCSAAGQEVILRQPAQALTWLPGIPGCPKCCNHGKARQLGKGYAAGFLLQGAQQLSALGTGDYCRAASAVPGMHMQRMQPRHTASLTASDPIEVSDSKRVAEHVPKVGPCQAVKSANPCLKHAVENICNHHHADASTIAYPQVAHRRSPCAESGCRSCAPAS